MSKVLDFANKRLNDELREKELGADNHNDIKYWVAYIDGANAMQREYQRQQEEQNAKQTEKQTNNLATATGL